MRPGRPTLVDSAVYVWVKPTVFLVIQPFNQVNCGMPVTLDPLPGNVGFNPEARAMVPPLRAAPPGSSSWLQARGRVRLT